MDTPPTTNSNVENMGKKKPTHEIKVGKVDKWTCFSTYGVVIQHKGKFGTFGISCCPDLMNKDIISQRYS